MYIMEYNLLVMELKVVLKMYNGFFSIEEFRVLMKQDRLKEFVTRGKNQRL